MSDDFEVIAEWIIRKLRDIDLSAADPDRVIRWVLYSLGVKDLGVDIYMYIRSVGRVTSTEIAEKFKISPTTARRYLEQLHTLGLVDYIGREYHLTRKNVASCIRDILIPRIKSVLEDIARVAESALEKEKKEKFLSRKDVDRMVLAPVRRELDRTLREAKREALKEIERVFSTTKYIGPKMVSKILSRVFDTLAESLRRLGEKTYRDIEIIKIEPTYPTKGLSIIETQDTIKYDVYSEYRLERRHLEYAKEKGKKIIIRVYDTLYLGEDISPDLIDVIEEIYVFGELIGPRNIIELLRDKIRGPGEIRYL